jgi:class 3 adenylate cyclase/tetratricopeptide (TPR) repeat protein
VLFADLAGFTSHTERSDPEDVRERLSTYHRRVREDVERFGGKVEKLMGDGVFAVFGVPTAHEDDRERAVRAGLRIQDSVAALNEQNPELELSVRIGITTGEAIVQLDPSTPDREGIIGDVVNTASRLEGAAAPGTVVVDERTHRGAVETIDFDEGRSIAVKGKVEPVRIWRALSPRSRIGTAIEDTHTTPFLGRDAELDLLVSTFDRTVREEAVQLVTIVGEPGVGKSRLLHEFRMVIDDRPDLVWWRQGRCLSYGDGIALWALGEIIKAQAGILDSDDATTAGEKLGRTVDLLFDDQTTAGWIRSRLEPVAGVTGSDEATAQELFAALTRFFEALAGRNPLILVIEDLQWAEPTLLEFIDHLTGWATESPILVAATARPEFLTTHPGWGGGKRNATTIGLSRLSDDDTARIIGSLLDRNLLDAGLQRELLDRCGGNPLYATEFVRYLTDRGLLSGSAPLGDLAVPDTIHGVIAARLDLLDVEEKAVLQAASVVGRVFWSAVLAEATGMSSEALRRHLRTLAARELIRPVREPSMVGQEEWTFTHALVNDVAYGQIPRGDRGRNHLSVTTWVERVSGERMGEVAELLAHHYGRVFDLTPAAVDDEIRSKAFTALMAAGERVIGFFYARGADYLRRAAEVAPTPAQRARARIDRARRFAAYDSIDDAERDAELAVEDATEAGDVELQAEARVVWSNNRWYRGDAEGRRQHLEEAGRLLEGRPPSPVTAEVITVSAFDAMVGGDSALALDIIEGGRQTVIAHGARHAYARMLSIEGSALIAEGHETGLDMLRESLDMHLDSNNTDRANSEYNNLATSAVFFRPAGQVLALINEAVDMCDERGYVAHGEFSRMTRIESLFPLGRWDDIRHDAEAILEADTARGGSRVSRVCEVWLAVLAAYAGDAEAAGAHLEAGAEAVLSSGDAQGETTTAMAGVVVSAMRGDDEALGRYADRLESSLTTAGHFADFCAGGCAAELVAAGRADQLRRLLSAARPGGPWDRARRLQARAVLAAHDGDHGGAVDAAMQSIEICESLEHVFDPIRSRLIAAKSLVALDRAEEATPLLERALDDASSIGAGLLASEARSLLGGDRARRAAGR